MGRDIKKVDVLQQTFDMLNSLLCINIIYLCILIVDKLVLSINKLETNHQCRPFFLHKDLMKEQNVTLGTTEHRTQTHDSETVGLQQELQFCNKVRYSGQSGRQTNRKREYMKRQGKEN